MSKRQRRFSMAVQPETLSFAVLWPRQELTSAAILQAASLAGYGQQTLTFQLLLKLLPLQAKGKTHSHDC